MSEAKDPVMIAKAVLKPISSFRNFKTATAAAFSRAMMRKPKRAAIAAGTF